MTTEIIGRSANDSQGPAGITERPLSQKSRKWLLSLARIKFQIELAALDICDGREFMAADVDPNIYRGDEGHLRSRSQSLRDRALRSQPVTGDEAWSFVVDQQGLQNWKIAHRLIRYTSSERKSNPDLRSDVDIRRSLSLPFVNLAIQLLGTAGSVEVDEFSRLSEIMDAVELQLSVLGSFGDLYHAFVDENGYLDHEKCTWHHGLRGRINVLEANLKRASTHPAFTRSPLQHHQDNLLLQAATCVFLLACIYPLYEALKSSSPIPGSTSDADFWQHIISAVIQLAGFLTLLLPIYRETAAKEWIGTWILIFIGVVSGLLTIPLYLFTPTSWSTFFSWLASAAQLLVVLQVALTASFRNREPVKQD